MDYYALVLLAETCSIYNIQHSFAGWSGYFMNSTEFNVFCELLEEAKDIKFDYHIPSLSVWFNRK